MHENFGAIDRQNFQFQKVIQLLNEKIRSAGKIVVDGIVLEFRRNDRFPPVLSVRRS